MSVCDEFIRWSNKWWADLGIKAAETSEDADARRQVLVDVLPAAHGDTAHTSHCAGERKIYDYLSFGVPATSSAELRLRFNDELCPAIEIDAAPIASTSLRAFDFFRKHESQYIRTSRLAG